MAVSGETIDHGPCAFMDTYDPATVFSSIDLGGRYAYGNQPVIALWNLSRLAEAMLPLFAADDEEAIAQATAVLERFMGRFERHWLNGMRARLGLFDEEDDDKALADDLLDWMQRTNADYTNTFRMLSTPGASTGAPADDARFALWRQRWQARLQRQAQSVEEAYARMRSHNPAYIARNHKVEEALAAASDNGDLSLTRRLLDALTCPYDYDARDLHVYGLGPPSGAAPYRTYCGT
jgi:uncharacterized protein YdiU (UPF0061 family)